MAEVDVSLLRLIDLPAYPLLSEDRGPVLYWIGYSEKERGFQQQSTWYRVIGPGHALSSAGTEVHYCLNDDAPQVPSWVEKSGVRRVVLHRVQSNPATRGVLSALRAMDVELIYDLDDHLLDPTIVDDSMPFRLWLRRDRDRTRDLFRSVMDALSYCDRALLATEELTAAALRLNPASVTAWNQVPAFFLSGLGYESDLFIEDRDRFKVFYGPGSRHHWFHVEVIDRAIEHFLAARRDAVFVLGGGLDLPQRLRRFSSRVRKLPPLLPRMYFHCLSRMDVILAPLALDRFSLAKSWIKVQEAHAVGIPWIATDAPSYRRFHELSGSGTCVPNLTEAWLDALHQVERGC